MASPYAKIHRSLLFNSYIYVPSGCHIPPISDDELLTRVNATNANDVDNGLGGWICRKCSRSPQPVPKPPAPVTLPVAANKPFTQQSASARPQPQAQSPDLALAKKFVVAPKLKYKQAVARKPSVRSRTNSDAGQASLTTSAAQPDSADVSSRKGSELLFTGSSSKEGISVVSPEPAPMASLATNQMQAATKDSGKDNAKSEAETQPTKKKIDPRRSGKSKNKRIPPNRSKGKATSREDDELGIETQNLQPSQPEQTTDISITTVRTEHEPSLGTLLSSEETFSHVSDSRRKRKESSVGRPESSLYTIEPGATLASDVSISLREMH